ncbi:MAG: hypothetical protein D4S01_00480 [Dehalococcoidia bacterium]|nr:MAG: hypothetical protein D4S01_00480 [Dehalococcoidia bacterium]
MDELDEKIALLFGNPIPFENNFVYPLTVDEIKEIKFSYFYMILQIIIADENDLEFIPEKTIVYPFDIFMSNLIYAQDDMFKEAIVSFLRKIFKKDTVFIDEEIIMIGEDINIHIHNYSLFVDIIKKQYCIEKEVKKPKTEKQKEIDKLRAEKRKKYAKWLEDESEDISDLFSSILSIHPTIDTANIGSKSIYYLVDQFKRINKRDDYFIGIKSLLAGASEEDVKLIHWTKKIVN